MPFPALSTLPTADLVARVRSGAPEALAELYRQYGDALMAVAYHITGAASDAEDVAWAGMHELADYRVAESAVSVIRKALDLIHDV